MAEARIPVDLFNPGQVFACLGFMEAAEILIGGAEGGFDWSEPSAVRFVLRANGAADPVREALRFLADAEAVAIEPAFGLTSNTATRQAAEATDDIDQEPDDARPETGPAGEADDRAAKAGPSTIRSESFPAPQADDKRNALPVRLIDPASNKTADLTHWWDKSGREEFKLYSGNRSALKIVRDMQTLIRQVWQDERKALVDAPFDRLVAMGGSFNLDPRGAWTPLDAGYSPDAQKHQVRSSAGVELFAAWGLEHARPETSGQRRYAYAAWREAIPLLLARPALACAPLPIPNRTFVFELGSSGKNKVVTFANEERAG